MAYILKYLILMLTIFSNLEYTAYVNNQVILDWRRILAKPHPGNDSLTKYMKTEFPWKKDFVCEPINMTFRYEDVVDALRKLKTTDPKLHRIGSYRWMSYRSRNDIANGLYMDSSTLKRYWDKFSCLIMNYLVHGDLIGELDPLDVIQMD